MPRSRVSALGAVAVVLVAITGLVIGNLARLQKSPVVVTSQGSTPVPEPDYITISQGEIMSRAPITRANMSTFIARATVQKIFTATFNTSSGEAPNVNYDAYDPPTSPFETVPVTATQTITQENEVYDDWVADGKLVTPFAIHRYAILDIDTVYKGDTSTEKLVLILPGGTIEDTSSGVNVGKVFKEVTSVEDLVLSEDIIIFSNQLWDWQMTHREVYPFIDRCIDIADSLVALSFEARCELLGAVYYVDGQSASSPDSGSSPYAITAIETEIAQALATEPVTSTLPYYTDPEHVGGEWPVPTP